MKEIDPNKSIKDLIKEDPKITDIVIALGHSSITNNVVLQFWGSITTLCKAAKLNGRTNEELIKILNDHGYTMNLDNYVEE